MKTTLLALPLAAILASAAGAQENPNAASPWIETRFHRVHLRNGNFIDGQLLQQTSNKVVLNLTKVGDFAVRRDQISRVEYIKMRSLREEPKLVAIPTPPALVPEALPDEAPKPAGTKPRDVPGFDRFSPDIRRSVDGILVAHAAAVAGQLLPLSSQISLLGDEAMAYACAVARHGRPEIKVPELIEAMAAWNHPDVIPALLAIMTGGPSVDRQAAVRALAVKGTPEALAAVHRACGDPSGLVWKVACEEVEKLTVQGKVNVEALVAVLNTTQEKAPVAELLGKVGGPAALEALDQLLENGSSFEKVMALNALAPAGRKEDGAFALDLLDDADPGVRSAISLFLGRIKYGPSVRSLIDALKDDEEDVVKSAHWALRQITKQTFGSTLERWDDWWNQSGKSKFPADGEDK